MNSTKYPHTRHLPWSPSVSRDDKLMRDVSALLHRPLICTEKADGSNCCLTRESLFARSHSGPPAHSSFDALKGLHAQIQLKIPPGISVFGEWVYAQHSIYYDRLPDWLLLFAVREITGVWWSWNDVGLMADELDVPRVAQLGIATVSTEHELSKWVSQCVALAPSYGTEKEGVVVRCSDSFLDDHFERCVGKWVRPDHVQTSDNWKHQAVVVNGRR